MIKLSNCNSKIIESTKNKLIFFSLRKNKPLSRINRTKLKNNNSNLNKIAQFQKKNRIKMVK